MKVLVVDDHENICNRVSAYVSRSGHESESASNGREALEKIHAAKPEFDLIISDICMPDMDGIEMLQSLRELPGGGPAVALMTGQETIESIQEALRLKAVDYIVKPVRPEDINGILERAELAIFDGGKPPQGWQLVNEVLRLKFPAEMPRIKGVMGRITTYLRPIEGRMKESLDDLYSCIIEGLRNAVIHGGESPDKSVELTLEVGESEIKVAIKDQGDGFNLEELDIPDDIEESDGRFTDAKGINFIKARCSTVAWDDGGREIHITQFFEIQDELEDEDYDFDLEIA